MVNISTDDATRDRQPENIKKAREAYEAAWSVFEALPQTAEVSDLWKQFVPAWQEWRNENNEFLKIMAELESFKLGDLTALQQEISTFLTDHYELAENVTDMVYDGTMFDGGADHTKCRFGEWVATQKSDNPQLLAIIRQAEEPHARLHEAVGKARQLVKDGNMKAAVKLYKEQLLPAMQNTRAQLLAIRDLCNKAQAVHAKANHQLLDVCRLSQDKANGILDRLIAINDEDAENRVAKAGADSRTATWTMVAAITLGGIALAVIGIFLARSISGVLHLLVSETNRLTEASVAGKLQTRGNPEIIGLEFRPIIEGINATLDAVIGPLNVSAEYIDRISKGDIPPRITDTYNGDFNEIKNNLNQCIGTVNAMVADVTLLVDAAVEGRLDVRADAAKHQGDFRKIIQGVNDAVGTLVGTHRLDAVAGDDYRQGFHDSLHESRWVSTRSVCPSSRSSAASATTTSRPRTAIRPTAPAAGRCRKPAP